MEMAIEIHNYFSIMKLVIGWDRSFVALQMMKFIGCTSGYIGPVSSLFEHYAAAVYNLLYSYCLTPSFALNRDEEIY